MDRLRIALGGLDFRLSSQGVLLLPPDDTAYDAFVSRGAPPDDVETADTVRLRLVHEPLPRFEGQLIFRSSASWAVYARNGARGVVHEGATRPLYAVHLEPPARDVLVQCSPELFQAGPPLALPCPFHYPLDQIVVMHLLGSRGFILHAACVLVQGRGVALAGVSGAGKTTFTRLADGRSGWQPLSDDRVVVRVSSSAVSVWGTPWAGEGQCARADSGPLDWLLFIEQGPSNRFQRLTMGQALHRLLGTASIPWYDAAALEATLAACAQALGRVRAGVLTFRPDGGAVELVEHLLAGR